MRLFKSPITGIAAMLVTLSCMSGASCDRLHEDLQPCVSGIRLRFIEQETLDEANIFYKQVDCLTLLIYDEEGNYLQTRTAAQPEIGDENWRMDIDLPAGHYNLLAYGGMDCAEASFSFTPNPASVPMQDLKVRMNPEYAREENKIPLHHLYYGAMELDVPEPVSNSYTEETLYMMKDTNDIRILLANADGLPTDEADFEFNIITDNTLMNYENDLIPAGLTTYWPWVSGNAEMGMFESEDPAIVAYAELSIGRLVEGNHTTLVITRKYDGQVVIRIPLINLLKLYKSERFASWPTQKFLDSESRWVITFFLSGDIWLRTKIVVNDWIVRINNISEM